MDAHFTALLSSRRGVNDGPMDENSRNCRQELIFPTMAAANQRTSSKCSCQILFVFNRNYFLKIPSSELYLILSFLLFALRFLLKSEREHSLDYFHCLSHSHCPLISKAKKRAKKRKAICKVHWDELFAHGELDWWWTLRVDCCTTKRVCRFDEARFAKVN